MRINLSVTIGLEAGSTPSSLSANFSIFHKKGVFTMFSHTNIFHLGDGRLLGEQSL